MASFVQTFPANVRILSNARCAAVRWINDTVAPADSPGSDASDLSADTELIVSELVTNGIQAGATQVELQLNLDDGVVEILIIDDGTGWPTPQHTTSADTHGRGLQIVNHLAEAWGVVAAADGRTTVWAKLRSRAGG